MRERWRIEPERSTLRFRIGHAVLGEIGGQFHCWGGLALLDKADLRRSAVRIWVDLSSIDAGSPERDEYILGTELFDLQSEPALVFDSERIELSSAGRGVVAGRLAVHSFSTEIAVVVEARAPRRDASGTWHLVYTARTSVNRAAIGLRRSRHIVDWLDERVLGETLEIDAHVEARRDDRAAADLPPRVPQRGRVLTPPDLLRA